MNEGETVGTDRREDFAAQMRAARAYLRISQAQVADRLGVSRQTVSAWERGRSPVPLIARSGVIEGLIDLGAAPGLLTEEEN